MQNALMKWEKENGIKLSEAKEIGLQFQIPPLKSMTMDLAVLTNCEKLSLSTNNIESIFLPPSLRNLKILALGRNNIKSLAGLEVLGETLEELWISYNFISLLKGIEAMKNLRKLYIAHNQVREWNEFQRLSALNENLRELIFLGNPLAASQQFRSEAIKRLPFLKMLDSFPASFN